MTVGASVSVSARPASALVRDVAVVGARWALGALLIYLGVAKALHPVDFLKILRQYDLVQNHLLLNLIASTLPWFEIFCGFLLVSGVAVRGTALLALLMLVPFSGAILHRALAIQQAKGLPLCAIRFDCGCGTGEVAVCHKLLENGLAVGLALLILLVWSRRWCLRYGLAGRDSVEP